MESFRRKGTDDHSTEVLLASLAPSTRKQYAPALRDWYRFCSARTTHPFKPSNLDLLRYLSQHHQAGRSYGSLNTIRSAISLIAESKVGEDPLVCRFMKGVFRLNPPSPRYKFTWDPAVVLNHLNNVAVDSLQLGKLSEKTVTLLALASGHRVQTFAAIQISCIHPTPSGLEIDIPSLIKTSGPGRPQPLIKLPFMPHKPQVCVASAIGAYLRATDLIRSSDSLFISTRPPHGPVTSQTISRWIKNCLRESGIDTRVFSAHSTRHASTSKAKAKGADIEVIRAAAGWTNSSQTFARFYNREVSDRSAFSAAVFS